ncbi:Uncharacterised protein [Mycobacteroides abscessus subsp. bolletii]|uniref:hypothetical protein n=1 Tax=Mycobacteroides abscessus TaxID=36809 RepID=UPI0009A86670|nr:hypothetical protein [Mycobacteroides abscessus]SKV05529.1 Uncharacterised protein [Mycobacteroides abscessus subsp. bolletii]
MAELSDAELRVVALTEATKFAGFRAAHSRVVPGSNQVLGAADVFLKFLKGEQVEGEGDGE